MDHLLDIPTEGMAQWLEQRGLPIYRARQIKHWVYQCRADSFEAMSNLPKSLRVELARQWRIWTTRIVRHSKSADGTEKLLLALHDDQQIECVLIREGSRRTVCISTQVGCAMGCVFCASGLDGVARNLTRGEIIEQVLQLNRLLQDEERLSHVVVMGMGEPLANLDHLLPALARVTGAEALDISARRVTISTVGLPPAMHRLADENQPYHLAVSLHAPDDALRNQLVPVNRKIGLNPILAAADHYFEVTHRRVTFEYVLLGGVNDSPEHAAALVQRLRGRPSLLNVIPYNRVAGLPYREPSVVEETRFLDVLRRGKVNVQVRRRKGEKIDAACGQLRRATAHQQTPIGLTVVEKSPP